MAICLMVTASSASIGPNLIKKPTQLNLDYSSLSGVRGWNYVVSDRGFWQEWHGRANITDNTTDNLAFGINVTDYGDQGEGKWFHDLVPVKPGWKYETGFNYSADYEICKYVAYSRNGTQIDSIDTKNATHLWASIGWRNGILGTGWQAYYDLVVIPSGYHYATVMAVVPDALWASYKKPRVITAYFKNFTLRQVDNDTMTAPDMPRVNKSPLRKKY
jgi:hypothetical protein